MKRCRVARLFVLVSMIGAAVAAHAQTYSVLYNFGTQPGRPWLENAPGLIAQGRNGNLYSGAGGGTLNHGAAYGITTGGGLTVIHSFNGSDGDFPAAGLTAGAADGILYGTTAADGTYFNGTIYKVGPTGAFATLHQFSWTEGFPSTGLTQALDGNFYGVTFDGGPYGYGVIYRITPTGQFSIIYQSDGSIYNVDAPLVLGNDGALYGGSANGGLNDYGALFKITTAGQFTLLYSFDQVNGAGAHGGMFQGTDGNFYGIARRGGMADSGVVFKMTPAGVYTALYQLNGTTDGQYPLTGLIQGSDGNFYGATNQGGILSSACPVGCGTVFKVTPQGMYSVLHTFTHTDGDSPYGAIYQHTNGVIYGTTRYGGAGTDSACQANCGVFFSVNAGLAPYAAFMPIAGARGGSVAILGQGFNGATAVSFGGLSASFTIVSDTCIIATVPTFAGTGPVTVTMGRQLLRSKRNFIVLR